MYTHMDRHIIDRLIDTHAAFGAGISLSFAHLTSLAGSLARSSRPPLVPRSHPAAPSWRGPGAGTLSIEKSTLASKTRHGFRYPMLRHREKCVMLLPTGKVFRVSHSSGKGTRHMKHFSRRRSTGSRKLRRLLDAGVVVCVNRLCETTCNLWPSSNR